MNEGGYNSMAGVGSGGNDNRQYTMQFNGGFNSSNMNTIAGSVSIN